MESDSYNLHLAGQIFVINDNETILQCALKNNILLKYRCASGYCGQCKVKLISGDVHLDHSGGISREEIAAGFILSCCAFPEGDVAIEMEV